MMSLKLTERIQTVKTVKFEVGRFTGSAIALLLLGLVATVSIFILKVAFTIAAIGIIIKIFSKN
mgnify:FL=1